MPSFLPSVSLHHLTTASRDTRCFVTSANGPEKSLSAGMRYSVSAAAAGVPAATLIRAARPIANPCHNVLIGCPPGEDVASPRASSQPSLATLVVLHVLEALAVPRQAHAEIELLDVLVVAQLTARAGQHDPAVLHHVPVIGDAQRHVGVLLDHEEGDPLLLPQSLDQLEDLGHD